MHQHQSFNTTFSYYQPYRGKPPPEYHGLLPPESRTPVAFITGNVYNHPMPVDTGSNPPLLRHTLKTIFGYDAFRPHQEEIIEGIIRGEDAFVLMPTGGGKSLCYQIPALHRPGVGIVVSPLISLMKDQVDALIANGVAAAFYNSSLKETEARRVLARFHGGELDLLYVAPERLMSESFLERLQEVEIALFAIDEAHCISQWGHDFRPEYVQLGRLRQLFPEVPLIALTATADPQTRADIIERLGLGSAPCYVAGFDRPNIRYTVLEKQKPLQQLLAFLKGRPDEAGIVYALSRKRVEEVAERLKRRHPGRRLPCRASRPGAETGTGGVPARRPPDRGGHGRLRHGDRQVQRPLRGPLRPPEEYRELLPGDRAGRAGRPSGRRRSSCSATATSPSAADSSSRAGTPSRTGSNSTSSTPWSALPRPSPAAAGCSSAISARLEEDCGNCDICLNPPERCDATEEAQKALSCVYRVGQRFGMGHVIEVLRGSHSQRITSLGHDRLSTYGIGRELSQDAWGSLIRQLVHLGYLEQDMGNYSVLRLTAKARPLLRGEERLTLARPRVRVDPGKAADKAGKGKARLRRGALPGTAGAPQAACRRAAGAPLRHLRRCHPGGDGRLSPDGCRGAGGDQRGRNAQAGALREQFLQVIREFYRESNLNRDKPELKDNTKSNRTRIKSDLSDYSDQPKP